MHISQTDFDDFFLLIIKINLTPFPQFGKKSAICKTYNNDKNLKMVENVEFY